VCDVWGFMICQGTRPPNLPCNKFVLRWLFRACIISGSSPFSCALCCVCVCVCQVAIKSMDQFWELTTRLREEHAASAATQQHSDRCVCVCVYTNIHTHIHTHTHQSCFCMRERIALLTRSITKSVSIGVCFKPFCDIFNVSLGLFRPLLTYSRCCLTHVCVRQGHPQPSVITSVCGLKLLVHVLTQVSVREAHAQAFAHDVC
jgi:hypothetical protein